MLHRPIEPAAQSDLARHARCTAAARQDAHANFHLHEFGFAARCESHIASKRELMAATSSKALDLGDRRLRQFADPLQHNLQIQQLHLVA